jgi:hypothetical protein
VEAESKFTQGGMSLFFLQVMTLTAGRSRCDLSPAPLRLNGGDVDLAETTRRASSIVLLILSGGYGEARLQP